MKSFAILFRDMEERLVEDSCHIFGPFEFRIDAKNYLDQIIKEDHDDEEMEHWEWVSDNLFATTDFSQMYSIEEMFVSDSEFRTIATSAVKAAIDAVDWEQGDDRGSDVEVRDPLDGPEVELGPQ